MRTARSRLKRPFHAIRADEIDHIVAVRTDWAGLEHFLELKGEAPVPRIAYLDGWLELMSPSIDHELLKKRIARLLELWAALTNHRLVGAGSWTVKRKKKGAGVEPDECYLIDRTEPGERPDLAIEVNWSRKGAEKLAIYHRLEVPEVWIWEEGQLQVWVRRTKEYVRATRSHVLPRLDLKLLAKLSLQSDQPRAVRTLMKLFGGRPAR